MTEIKCHLLNKNGSVVVDSLLEFCNCSMFVMLYVTLCQFWFCNHLDGEERAGWATLLSLSPWCLAIVVSSRCHGFVCSL